MIALPEILLTLMLLANLALAGSGRLHHAIRLMAAQGWMVGLLPLLLWNWGSGLPPARVLTISVVNALVKGVLLPMLLAFAVRKAGVVREVEPIVGFRSSLCVVFLAILGSFAIGRALHIHEAVASELAIPAAISTMFTGLFLTCSRRKAITQVIGFLSFENGIAVFGAGILMEYGIVVELGILLDVFVLVFVLGIAIQQISRTFSSIDTDKLNRLGDTHLLHHHH